MNFFQSMSRLFGSKLETNNQPVLSEGQNNNQDNYIAFTINSENIEDPYVKINITDTSKEASMRFADMLFNINSGHYHQSILDLLLNMSSTDNEIKEFVQNTIIFWTIKLKQESVEQQVDNNSQDNKPYISPMDFNKYATTK